MTLDLADLRRSLIGANTPIDTPFGPKPLVYADYTASGRSVDFIEDYIRQQVLPFYANTHSESSFTGRQTTALREQARAIIRTAVGAGPEHKLIFCGSGATAAINRLINILGLNPSGAWGRAGELAEADRPVVFIGPYEHHSNELAWRESLATVVPVPLGADGCFDLRALEACLDAYRQRPFKLASFSAASNVTGIKAPIAEINKRLKAAGVWSCWDYAAAAPYVGIDMSADGLDAVYISPHKFIGGPGSPGVLLLNQAMVKNSVPSVPGGGTVSFVSPEGHRYLNDIERREEGGTPAIVESIRAGLAFALQQKVGTERIEALEQAHLQRAIGRLKQVPEIELLGNLTAPRLAIIALRIKHRHEYLHYGFAVALLNDLFGIQVRGGCSCAGPYGHQLLGLSRAQSKALDSAMAAGQTLLRPGWLRFNLNYFIATEELDYILSALELVAQEGWRLLPYYQYISEAGVWAFQGRRTPLPASLEDCGPRPQLSPLPQAQPNYEQLLASARTTLLQPQAHWRQFSLELPEQAEALRWFSLPQMPA